jgi:hypothetical protein
MVTFKMYLSARVVISDGTEGEAYMFFSTPRSRQEVNLMRILRLLPA